MLSLTVEPSKARLCHDARYLNLWMRDKPFTLDSLNDLPRYVETHDYNLRGSNYDLQLPLPKTNFLKRSFSYRGAMAWNQLSNETREMGDLTSFKLAIS